ALLASEKPPADVDETRPQQYHKGPPASYLAGPASQGASQVSRPIIICDIDGVIADCGHRLHLISGGAKDWDSFFEACSGDMPMPTTIRFLKEVSGAFEIVYVTGRPERTRAKTIAWFEEH